LDAFSLNAFIKPLFLGELVQILGTLKRAPNSNSRSPQGRAKVDEKTREQGPWEMMAIERLLDRKFQEYQNNIPHYSGELRKASVGPYPFGEKSMEKRKSGIW